MFQAILGNQTEKTEEQGSGKWFIGKVCPLYTQMLWDKHAYTQPKV